MNSDSTTNIIALTSIPFNFVPSPSDIPTSTFKSLASDVEFLSSPPGSPRSLPPGASYSTSQQTQITMMTKNENLLSDSHVDLEASKVLKEDINPYWGSPVIFGEGTEGEERISDLNLQTSDSLTQSPTIKASCIMRPALPIPPTHILSPDLLATATSHLNLDSLAPQPQQEQLFIAPSSTLPPSPLEPSTSPVAKSSNSRVSIPLLDVTASPSTLPVSPPTERESTSISPSLPMLPQDLLQLSAPSSLPSLVQSQPFNIIRPTSNHRRPSFDLSPFDYDDPSPSSPQHLAASTSRMRVISPSSAQPVYASNLPSFSPAAAFSAQDRGPYPPHVSPSRGSTTSPLLGFNSTSGGTGYFDNGIGIGGMGGIENGFYPTLRSSSITRTNNNIKGKGREGDLFDPINSVSNNLPRRSSQFFSDSLPRGETDIRPIPGGLGQDDMAGVGRNSLIRNSGVFGSPNSGNRFMGPVSGVIGVNPVPGKDSPKMLAAQQQQPLSTDRRPPHLIPQPEICVECMVRDRDMMDVDVTGEGVWARESDFDWEEALRWEELDALTSGNVAGGSIEKASEESYVNLPAAGSILNGNGGTGGSQLGKRRTSGGAGSRESMAGSSTHYGKSMNSRRRIGKAQPLSEANLKLWTSMNIPASAHRWKTLQSFLAMQIHFIELERNARDQQAIERERLGKSDLRQFPSSPQYESAKDIGTESIGGAEGENIKSRGRTNDGNRGSIASSFFNQSKTQSRQASPVPSQQSYAYGDQPWLSKQARRFSSPALKDLPPPSPGALNSPKGFGFSSFGRSSTDLRSSNASPRSPSPGRTSSGRDDRRGSLWSKFRSQSVLSFLPSGSMIDMHLGLSMDKEAAQNQYRTYPSMSDPAMTQQSEKERYRSNSEGQQALAPKLKKKGIKRFFNKLMTSNDVKKREDRARFESTASRMAGAYDNTDLMPPPPLSALVNEPRYHQRTSSNSSVDSSYQRRSQSPTSKHPYASPTKPIVTSIYSPRTSSPEPLDTYSFNPSMSPVRQEKSLPSLPPTEIPNFSSPSSPINYPYASSPNQSQSQYYNQAENINNQYWNPRQSQQSLQQHQQHQQNLPPNLRGSRSFSSDLRNSANLHRASQSWIDDSRRASEDVEEIDFNNSLRKSKGRSSVWARNFGLGKRKKEDGGTGRDDATSRVSEETISRVNSKAGEPRWVSVRI